jgi:hypothetical protein
MRKNFEKGSKPAVLSRLPTAWEIMLEYTPEQLNGNPKRDAFRWSPL